MTDLTPAQELRNAAERIREVATKAMPGPWHNLDNGDRLVTEPDDKGEFQYVLDEPLDANNAAHIALWHPGVALLVAAWLESEADGADYEAANSIYGAAGNEFVYTAGDGHPALKLAQTILGAVSDAS